MIIPMWIICQMSIKLSKDISSLEISWTLSPGVNLNLGISPSKSVESELCKTDMIVGCDPACMCNIYHLHQFKDWTWATHIINRLILFSREGIAAKECTWKTSANLVLISVLVHPDLLHCAITTAASEHISCTQKLSCVQIQIWAFFEEQEVRFPHLRALRLDHQPWRLRLTPTARHHPGQWFGRTGSRASPSPAEEGSCRCLVWVSVQRS